MEKVDVIIIGAGVAGLAVASETANKDRDVLLLEKNSSWGQETSSRNSEVIHAGIYYKPGSLKAVSCREGRNALYKLCPENGIGIQKTGKLIVAVKEEEVLKLEQIQQTAAGNGVNLSLIGKDEVNKKEPHVSAVAALWSPETGIVDSHCLMRYFLDKATAQGADVVYEADVLGIEKSSSGFKVVVNNQGETIEIESAVVINCAGNSADKIAAMAGIDIIKEGYEQYYLKGSYFRLSDKFRGMTKHLVYPVPDEDSLGIHTVLDLSGGIRLGPDAEKVSCVDYHVNENKKKEFYESVKKFLPQVKEDELSVDMAGVRPQLKNSDVEGFKDFIVNHEQDKGLPGFINLIGIESPGLTASPYIGRFVAKMVDQVL